MRTFFRSFAVLALIAATAAGLSAQSKATGTQGLGPGEYATFYTNKGMFVAQLFPKDAPKSVANFVQLAQGQHPYKNPLTGGLSMDKLYDGLLFFRTVPDYLLQTGDPLNNGTGRLGYSIPYEKNALKFDTAGRMALAQVPGDPTSRGSQIFFLLKPAPFMDNHGYLIIGQIVRGLDVAVALSQGPRRGGARDLPAHPNILNKVTIENIK